MRARLALALVLGMAAPAAAQPPGAEPLSHSRPELGAGPAEIFSRARAAERRFEYAAARDGYRELMATHRGHRLAARAQQRDAWIEARAVEGELAPLSRLMRWASAPVERQATRDYAEEAESLPPGRLRRDAWSRLTRAAIELGDEELAIEYAARNLAAAEDGSESERFAARRLQADALELAGADEALDELLAGPLAGSGLAAARESAVRRAQLEPFLWGALLGWLLVLIATVVRSPRPPAGRARAVWQGGRAAAAPAALLAVPSLIAAAYDEEAADTFGLLWTTLTLVLTMSIVVSAQLPARAGRRRVVLGVATVLAVAASSALVLITRGLGVIGFGA